MASAVPQWHKKKDWDSAPAGNLVNPIYIR
jgi:hypothetical protein